MCFAWREMLSLNMQKRSCMKKYPVCTCFHDFNKILRNKSIELKELTVVEKIEK